MTDHEETHGQRLFLKFLRPQEATATTDQECTDSKNSDFDSAFANHEQHETKHDLAGNDTNSTTVRTKAQKQVFQRCKKRAQKRWCRWLTSNKSRIGHTNTLRETLGEHFWQDFVTYATTHYKSNFVDHFATTMRCCGKIDGQSCPHAYAVDPWCPADLSKLEGLHLDHSYELSDICKAWKDAIGGRQLRSWDDWVNGDLVCHLLFGVKSTKTGIKPAGGRYLATASAFSVR